MGFLVILAILVLAPIFLFFALLFLFFKGLFEERGGATITGKAFVIDGDTIKVSGRTIRLAGLDAPEVDQVAKHQHGYWFAQGKRVKSALIRAIGGKHVLVTVEGHDRYGRVVGTVTCNGKDVGEWLVSNGYAIAAYGEQYKPVEREARRARRGMWGHAEVYDPRAWRNREQRPPGRLIKSY